MTAPRIVAVVHACAPNDTNGNPRRVFVGLDRSGNVARVTDEGYAGRPGWVRARQKAGCWPMGLDVTPAQYRALLSIRGAEVSA